MTPYQMGQKARRRGQQIVSCPFNPFTQEEHHNDWTAGWSDTDDGINDRERIADEKFDSLFAV